MVAQPAAGMAAVSSSGEEPALEVSPAPAEEIQEQAAPSMMAMMALLVEKVGGLQKSVDQVSARTMTLEGAMADVSLSSSEELPTGRGSVSAVTMVTASADRRKRAPDQGSSQDEALHAQGNGGDAATASDALATATASGATAAKHIAEVDSGDGMEAAAAAEAAAAHLVLAPPSAGGPAAEPPTPTAHLVSASAGGKKLDGPSGDKA
eukprot:COSAG06_NODE_4070_length_4606_cov_39.200799_4_plen_208_part_00